MKSRIYTTFSFLCGLLLALGCQRIPDVEEFATEYQSGSSSGYERLISKVSIVLPYSEEYQGLITFKFEYDSSDRVVSMDTEGNYVADDRDGNTSQYVYTPHSVRQTTTGINIMVGPVDMDVQYYYDADGFVKSCVHEGMETFPEYVFGYTDDYLFEDGLISAISSQSADLSFVRNYEWVDGNIVREVTYENSEQQFEISYTYTEYEDKCNIDLLRLAFYLNYYKGLHFMADKVAFKGISNKNLPLKQIQFVDEETYSFEYEFDEEGYVKTVTIYMDGDLFQVMHVTYQDENLDTSHEIDLGAGGTANSYIVSNPGTYKFKPVKGNSSTSVGSVSKVDVLWESFGTSEAPSVGDLIKSVNYDSGYIVFATPSSFKEGNAVIAAKDVNGKILWSWHIWLTDQPEEHVYENNAGTMMDRNLGATSATPGDVGALGLLYQWGRKDPFLGSSSISSSIEAESTITWPSVVSTSSSTGTVDYVTSHPTTFVTGVFSSDYDWFYSSRDNSLWTTSDKTKSIYDPCPAGWRVPDGGSNGVWSKAGFDDTTYDSTNEGMSFSISSPSTTWYPASGCRLYDGSLSYVGSDGGVYWSASPSSIFAFDLCFSCSGYVYPSDCYNRAYGQAVRCVKEGTQTSGGSQTPDVGQEKPLASSASDLGTDGSANSYIVTKSGTYKFKPVKGNSSKSVDSVSKVEVLWETFGTSETPSVGDLIKSVNYDSGYIVFSTPSSFNEGNAVIAAKDAYGKILWSWHIWLTDQPEEQVYKYNAGTMMDRNLGATSTTPGDVGALGLLYQWGRKDPFLGSSAISINTLAKSTITWPSAVSTSSSTGTVDYVTSHPTTFVTGVLSSEYDWCYSSRDNSLWTTSDKTKSIYDPCPAGWRVPDGGSNGVWSKAGFDDKTYGSTNEGMSFSISSPSTTWYPASGARIIYDGSLHFVGSVGNYWSASSISDAAYGLSFGDYGNVYPSINTDRANGRAVRCVKEGSQTPDVGQEKPLASSASDLGTDGSANSYIVTKSGTYKFKPVKGNSSTSVGSVSKVEVLWETFGTSETPFVGDLIKSVNYDSGYIVFATPSSFNEGNAVIAAKDADGKILWSWHIWLTDEPKEQVYKNNAGTMMDRNLGATSSTPGDVGALGLLYQWGRKDPFLGSSSISSSIEAESTLTRPSAVSTSSSTGTVDYVTSHPTTYLYASSSPYDWHYSSRDNSLWTTSDKTKSIYDPCPAGWRVPDGGSNGVWSKAGFDDTTYDSTNEGMSFSISSPSTTWYPASGYRVNYDGSLYRVGSYGDYWSASPGSRNAYCLVFINDGYVDPSGGSYRAYGKAVRCQKE